MHPSSAGSAACRLACACCVARSESVLARDVRTGTRQPVLCSLPTQYVSPRRSSGHGSGCRRVLPLRRPRALPRLPAPTTVTLPVLMQYAAVSVPSTARTCCTTQHSTAYGCAWLHCADSLVSRWLVHQQPRSRWRCSVTTSARSPKLRGRRSKLWQSITGRTTTSRSLSTGSRYATHHIIAAILRTSLVSRVWLTCPRHNRPLSASLAIFSLLGDAGNAQQLPFHHNSFPTAMADHLVGNSAFGDRPVGALEFDFAEAVFANQSEVLRDSTNAGAVELLTNIAATVGINTTAFAAGALPHAATHCNDMSPCRPSTIVFCSCYRNSMP